jgi:[heparan sulfate]-glucosamine 3-sulfotransferase 3
VITKFFADYAQTASKRSNMPEFESMAFNRSTGEVNRRWGAIKLSTYARHVKRWLVYFPLTQMHFVNGEKLIYEPVATVNGVERFLGLTPQVRDADFEWHTNDGRKFACIHRHDEPTHCLGKTKGRKHPDVTDVNMRRLRQYFTPYNEQFYSLVGQRFYW